MKKKSISTLILFFLPTLLYAAPDPHSFTVQIDKKDEVFYPKTSDAMRKTVDQKNFEKMLQKINRLLQFFKESHKSLLSYPIEEIEADGEKFYILPTPQDGLCHQKALGLPMTSNMIGSFAQDIKEGLEECDQKPSLTEKEKCKDSFTQEISQLEEMLIPPAERNEDWTNEERVKEIFGRLPKLLEDFETYLKKNGGKSQGVNGVEEARGRPHVGERAALFFAKQLGVDIYEIDEFTKPEGSKEKSKPWSIQLATQINGGQTNPRKRLYLVKRWGGKHYDMGLPVDGPFSKPILLTTLDALKDLCIKYNRRKLQNTVSEMIEKVKDDLPATT